MKNRFCLILRGGVARGQRPRTKIANLTTWPNGGAIRNGNACGYIYAAAYDTWTKRAQPIPLNTILQRWDHFPGDTEVKAVRQRLEVTR